MTPELRSHLQSTLGDGYTLERELGGGGMSRVFVARENALGRDVVVKVLAPELSASVSAERFTREIATAARLQQADIVPVLAAGTSGGVSYYTMPFVKGASLRTLLSSGALISMHDRCNKRLVNRLIIAPICTRGASWRTNYSRARIRSRAGAARHN